MSSPKGTPNSTERTNPSARACRLTASAWKSCPETSSSVQTVMTFERGGSKWALPERPAISQIAPSVTSEMILSVLGFIRLFASDFFQHLLQGTGVEGLLEAYGVLFEQSRFFEKLDAGLAALLVGAAVDIPDS